jgi:uracil-DNA glycosylase
MAQVHFNLRFYIVGQAHGLAFSVRKGIKVPPSLVNIYKGIFLVGIASSLELSQDLKNFTIPNHGCLSKW